MLVAGLSDAELARIVPELDADEVLGVALRELAVRAAPVADAFAAGSLSFVVADQSDRDVVARAHDATATTVGGREPVPGRGRARGREHPRPVRDDAAAARGHAVPRRRGCPLARHDDRRRRLARARRPVPARDGVPNRSYSGGRGSDVRCLNRSSRACSVGLESRPVTRRRRVVIVDPSSSSSPSPRRERIATTTAMTTPSPTSTPPAITTADGPLDVLGGGRRLHARVDELVEDPVLARLRGRGRSGRPRPAATRRAG